MKTFCQYTKVSIKLHEKSELNCTQKVSIKLHEKSELNYTHKVSIKLHEKSVSNYTNSQYQTTRTVSIKLYTNNSYSRFYLKQYAKLTIKQIAIKVWRYITFQHTSTMLVSRPHSWRQASTLPLTHAWWTLRLLKPDNNIFVYAGSILFICILIMVSALIVLIIVS